MKRKPSPSPKTPAAKSPAAKSPRAASGPRAKAAPSPKPAAKKAKASPASAPASEATTKQSQLISLLRSETGASMADMMTLTGWQPHTVRGMLSGSLRKRLGLDVQCQRVDGAHLYRIVEVAAS